MTSSCTDKPEGEGVGKREWLGAWRPEPMTPETAPEWLSELSPEEYAARRNQEQQQAILSLDLQKDWLTVAASMLHCAGTMSPSEYGSYGHSCIIVAEALIATRDQIIAEFAARTPQMGDK